MSEPVTQLPRFDIQLSDVWPIFWKQKNIIILFLSVVFFTTALGVTVQERQYRATALINVTPKSGQEVGVDEVIDLNTRGFYEIQQFFRTQIQIMQSRKVREEAVRRFVAMGYDDFEFPDAETGEMVTDVPKGGAMLKRMMTVVPEQQSQLLNIHVTYNDPIKAMLLANLLAESYKDLNLRSRQSASEEASAWLDTQIVEYTEKTKDAQLELLGFKEAEGVIDADERITTISARMQALNEAYAEATTSKVLVETKVSSHERLLRRGKYQELAKVLDTDLARSLARDHASATSTDAKLAARYGPQHPDRQRVAKELERIRDEMESEVRRSLDGEKALLSVSQSKTSSLKAEIDVLKQELLTHQEKIAAYERQKSQLDQDKEFLDRLTKRRHEVQLSSRTQFNNVQVIDEAVEPKVPVKPNVPLSLGIALVVGSVGGLALALLREYIDDTVSSQFDVVSHLKVPFLGLIPKVPDGTPSREADLYTHLHPRSSVAEAVRGLRAMLELNPDGPPPRRLLVTSSVAREGKTATTVKLGVSFAQMGRSVVLVDADLRRPRLHKVFGKDLGIGVSSYMLNAANADEILIPTPVPNMMMIPAGPSTDHPTELMASNGMERLLDDLSQKFDIVILDTPPSVALSDAVTLSRLVDGIVLVVKEQSVSRAVVKQTIDMLRQVEANILGVVLNNVDLSRSGSKYKYYYAYRDYYQYTSDEKRDSGAAA